MSNIIVRLAVAGLFVAGLALAGPGGKASGPIRTGVLRYNVGELLSPVEGTIEFWFQPHYETASILPQKAYHGLFALLRLHGRDGGLGIGHSAGGAFGETAGIFLSIGSGKVPVHGAGIPKVVPKPGSWHHFAVAWQGRDLWMYLDGKERVHKTLLGPMSRILGPLGEEPLVIGDKWGRRGLAVIDEVRLSIVARKPKELGWHGPLEPDPLTSLLDRFDGPAFVPDGKLTTHPAVLFAGRGGVPSPACQFTQGRFGGGLALFKLSPTGKENGP